MKRIRIMGLALVAILAVGGVSVASASAALPELGRCSKLTPEVVGKRKVYHGLYSNKSCTRLQSKKAGHYEWTAGPGTANKFYASITEPVFETVTGGRMVCSVLILKGEYLTEKTEKASISIAGCENAAKQPCQTEPAKEGLIEGLSELEGTLAFIRGGEKPIVGWDLKHETDLFTFECGKLPEVGDLQEMEGSVIGAVEKGEESNLDRMNIDSLVAYKAKSGAQEPEAFEGGEKDTLIDSSPIAKTTEQTGLTGVDEQDSGLGEPIEKPENEEPLEIRAKA
jgi:hypothetical protein